MKVGQDAFATEDEAESTLSRLMNDERKKTVASNTKQLSWLQKAMQTKIDENIEEAGEGEVEAKVEKKVKAEKDLVLAKLKKKTQRNFVPGRAHEGFETRG